VLGNLKRINGTYCWPYKLVSMCKLRFKFQIIGLKSVTPVDDILQSTFYAFYFYKLFKI